jgi:hypothetical protein
VEQARVSSRIRDRLPYPFTELPRDRFTVVRMHAVARTNQTMIGRWTTWKTFPDADHGGHIEAPIGPGVYEVCHVATGEQVAFGYAANVAQAMSNVLPPASRRGWPFFRRAARPQYQSGELEYRTCSAASAAEARLAVEQLMGQRQALLRRFAARH